MSSSVVVGLLLLVLVQSSAALLVSARQYPFHRLSLPSYLSSASFLLSPSSAYDACDQDNSSQQVFRQQQLESSSSLSPPATTTNSVATILKLPHRPSRVVVNNVSHKYPITLMHKLFSSMPQREYAIRNITISFGHFNNNYGSDDDTANDDDGVILLVGRSGSGKSTLLRLLSGIECPNADGCIVVNGQTMASTSKKMGMMPGLPSWVKMGIVPRVQSPSGSDEERRGEIEAHAAIQPVILEGKPDFDDSQSVLERIVQVGEDAVSRFEKYAGWKQHRRSDATTTMLQILAEDIAFLLMLTSKQKCRPSELSPSGEYLFGIACGCMMSMAPSFATSCHANCNSKVENENFVGVHYPILLLDELFDTEHPSIVESCSNGMLNLIRAGGIILSATHRPGHFRGISSRTITLSGGKVLGRIDEPY